MNIIIQSLLASEVDLQGFILVIFGLCEVINDYHGIDELKLELFFVVDVQLTEPLTIWKLSAVNLPASATQ